MNIDIAKSGIQNLLDLINADNPAAALTTAKVDLAAPVVAAGANGRNTTVVVTAKANQAFEGSVTVSLRRIAVNEATASPDTSYGYDDDDTWAQLLTAVAAGLGVREEDVEFTTYILNSSENPISGNGPADVLVGEAGQIRLAAKAGSYLYVGNVLIDMIYDKPDLDTVVTTTDLNGFDPVPQN